MSKHSATLADYHKHYDRFVARHYPGFQETWQILAELAEDAIQPNDIILNVGAGHSTRMEKIVRDRNATMYALDPDEAALAQNTLATRKIVGKAEAIPLADHSVDVILLEWVLEHIANPKEAFREMARVLRPGGRLVFATPNILGPVMLFLALIKRVSEGLSETLISTHLRDVGRGDVYPAYYRANTHRKLSAYFRETGLVTQRLLTTGNPGYFRFFTPLLWLSLQWEKLSAQHWMRWSQAYLLGIATKRD